jgi:hypothetical protein
MCPYHSHPTTPWRRMTCRLCAMVGAPTSRSACSSRRRGSTRLITDKGFTAVASDEHQDKLHVCGSPRTSTTGTLDYPDLDDLGSKRRGKRPGRWQGGLGLGGAIQRDEQARVHRSSPVAVWPQDSGKQRI